MHVHIRWVRKFERLQAFPSRNGSHFLSGAPRVAAPDRLLRIPECAQSSGEPGSGIIRCLQQRVLSGTVGTVGTVGYMSVYVGLCRDSFS